MRRCMRILLAGRDMECGFKGPSPFLFFRSYSPIHDAIEETGSSSKIHLQEITQTITSIEVNKNVHTQQVSMTA